MHLKILWIFGNLCLFVNNSAKCSNVEKSLREKRQVNSIPIVFPYGATYKLLIGATLPIQNQDNISFAFLANFQYQYLQIQNITQLSQYYFIKEISREQRDAIVKVKRNERLTFYRALEGLLETQGIDGKECVLRAICEAAQYPMEEEGLVGEIMHILLMPDYGHTAFEVPDPDWKEAISKYKDAATAGRQMFSCSSIYSGCPEGQGILELFTKLKEN